MNIAYLLDTDRWDPATIYTRDLACAMKRQGHEVVVCIPRNDSMERFFKEAKLDTRKIILRTLASLSPAFLSSLIKDKRLSIIHANNILTASIAIRGAQLSGRKDVMTILTYQESNAGSPIVMDILNSLDAITLPSGEIPPSLKEIQARMLPLRYCVPAANRSAREPSPTKIITVNGPITPDKEIEKLMEAASRLDGVDYRIRIIGEGKAAHVMPLKQAAQRFGISDRVEWPGNRPDVRDLIKDSDVGVELSGLRGLYNVAEFTAAGVPAIVCGDSGIKYDITDGENGFIVHRDNLVEELTEALRTTLADPAFRIRFESRRQDGEAGTFDNYAVRLASIYSSLL